MNDELEKSRLNFSRRFMCDVVRFMFDVAL